MGGVIDDVAGALAQQRPGPVVESARVAWVVHPINDGRKTQRGTATINAADEPCPCVTADGIGAAPRHRAWLERTVRRAPE